MTSATIRTALRHMVTNVTTSAALVTVLSGKATVHKDHVAVVVAHLRDTCGPKARAHTGRGQHGGAGAPWAFEDGGGTATPSAAVSAAAYSPSFGAGTRMDRIDVPAGVARPGLDVAMTGGAAAALPTRDLRAGIRAVLRSHNLKIAKDARALLERTLVRLGTCFANDAAAMSETKLQRTLAGRRYKVFRM